MKDEFSFDISMERMIQDAMARFDGWPSCTVSLWAAHRLSTIRYATKFCESWSNTILSLNVVTHELLATNGAYAKLYKFTTCWKNVG